LTRKLRVETWAVATDTTEVLYPRGVVPHPARLPPWLKRRRACRLACSPARGGAGVARVEVWVAIRCTSGCSLSLVTTVCIRKWPVKFRYGQVAWIALLFVARSGWGFSPNPPKRSMPEIVRSALTRERPGWTRSERSQMPECARIHRVRTPPRLSAMRRRRLAGV
jgi:hypothetical protein